MSSKLTLEELCSQIGKDLTGKPYITRLKRVIYKEKAIRKTSNNSKYEDFLNKVFIADEFLAKTSMMQEQLEAEFGDASPNQVTASCHDVSISPELPSGGDVSFIANQNDLFIENQNDSLIENQNDSFIENRGHVYVSRASVYDFNDSGDEDRNSVDEFFRNDCFRNESSNDSFSGSSTGSVYDPNSSDADESPGF